jgi:hypothetical protein
MNGDQVEAFYFLCLDGYLTSILPGNALNPVG